MIYSKYCFLYNWILGFNTKLQFRIEDIASQYMTLIKITITIEFRLHINSLHHVSYLLLFYSFWIENRRIYTQDMWVWGRDGKEINTTSHPRLADCISILLAAKLCQYTYHNQRPSPGKSSICLYQGFRNKTLLSSRRKFRLKGIKLLMLFSTTT